MTFVGMDVHKNESQICVIDSGTGEVVHEIRVPTSDEGFESAFGKIKGARILLEASTTSSWVASHLRTLSGVAEVIVADPNNVAMYGRRGRGRQKTDKRDAFALATALMSGNYTKVHEPSEVSRTMRREVRSRSLLMTQRTMLVNEVRAQLEFAGIKQRPPSIKGNFIKTIRESRAIAAALKRQLEPTLLVLEALQRSIGMHDAEIESAAKNHPDVKRVMTIPGFGALTAVALVAQFDVAKRFPDSRHASAYLGLVPHAHGSGDTDGRMGGITKTGDRLVRALLVQGAMSVMGKDKTPESLALRRWAGGLQQRSKSRKLAAVALARRLCRIAYACLRDGTEFMAAKTQASLPA